MITTYLIEWIRVIFKAFICFNIILGVKYCYLLSYLLTLTKFAFVKILLRLLSQSSRINIVLVCNGSSPTRSNAVQNRSGKPLSIHRNIILRNHDLYILHEQIWTNFLIHMYTIRVTLCVMFLRIDSICPCSMRETSVCVKPYFPLTMDTFIIYPCYYYPMQGQLHKPLTKIMWNI